MNDAREAELIRAKPQFEHFAEHLYGCFFHPILGSAGDHGGPGNQISLAAHFLEDREGSVPIAAFGVEGDKGVGDNGVQGKGGVEEAAMEETAASKVAGADAGAEEDGVGDKVSGDTAAGHEVEGGEGIVEAAAIGETDDAVLQGLEGRVFGGCWGLGNGGGDGGFGAIMGAGFQREGGSGFGGER